MDHARRLDLLIAERQRPLLVSSLVNIRYLTGFTGSAAWLLVTPEECVFATDGRYGELAEELSGRLERDPGRGVHHRDARPHRRAGGERRGYRPRGRPRHLVVPHLAPGGGGHDAAPDHRRRRGTPSRQGWRRGRCAHRRRPGRRRRLRRRRQHGVRRRHRGRTVRRSRRVDAGRRRRTGGVAPDRRRRGERRPAPPPDRRWPDRRRPAAARLRLPRRWIPLRHEPNRVARRRARCRAAPAVRCRGRVQRDGYRRRPSRRHRRRRRRGVPGGAAQPRVGGPLPPLHRATASVSRSTRRHGRGASRKTSSSPAMCSPSNRASISPGSAGCASRTWWW